MSRSVNIWFKFNQRIIQWTRDTWDLQSRNLQNAIKKGTDETVSSLQFVNGRDDGMVDYAGFRFIRRGIFIEKGVGGVYKINPEGSGIVTRSTPGAINRVPNPWLKPAFDEQMPKLTAIIAEEMAAITSSTLADSLEKVVKMKGFK